MERLNKIDGMVVGDKLQRISHTGNDVVLANNYGHWVFSTGRIRPEFYTPKGRHQRDKSYLAKCGKGQACSENKTLKALVYLN